MARTLGSTNKPKLVTWNGTKRDPAAYVASVMLDDTADQETRLKAAIALLPFVHRKQPTEIESDAPLSAIQIIVRRD